MSSGRSFGANRRRTQEINRSPFTALNIVLSVIQPESRIVPTMVRLVRRGRGVGRAAVAQRRGPGARRPHLSRSHDTRGARSHVGPCSALHRGQIHECADAAEPTDPRRESLCDSYARLVILAGFPSRLAVATSRCVVTERTALRREQPRAVKCVPRQTAPLFRIM